MDDRRDILIALAWRLLLAVPLGVTAWFLFATTRGDPNGGGERFLGLMCAVAAAIVIAPPFAVLVAEPAGSLFYPRRHARPDPRYSAAEGRRMRRRHEEAIAEFEHIAAQFPAEVRPYVAMMEITLLDLHDSERAGAIVKRGLATVRDDASRKHLLWKYRIAKAKLRAAPQASMRENEGEADRTESDIEAEG